MAGNMDPNDLNGVAEALEELRKGSSLSAETLAKLSSSGKDADDAQRKLVAGLKAYGQQVTAAIGGLKNGGGSFQSLSASVDLVSTSISKVAGQFGIVGKVIGGIATGLGEAAKIALSQLDDITKNYQALGDASAVATDGIDGLYRQFNALGNYSLPAFTKAVKTNVQGISALGGTAALGAEELSKVSGVLTTGQIAQRFLKLGMSLDAVGDITAEYLSTMSRLGLTQGSSTDELTKKTQNYIVEVDKIARLTGQTREAQQQEAQKNLADFRYRAKISQMRANGESDAAEQIELFVRGLGAINPALAENARATITGTYLTNQAAEGDILLNGAIRRNFIALEQNGKATTSIADVQEALAQSAVQFRTQFMYGRDLGGLGQAAYDVESLLLRRKELESEGLSQEAAIEQAQTEAMEASGKLTDKITGAQLSAANASKNIQSLSFSLAAVAAGPLESFAGALERATDAVNKRFGVGGKYSTPAGVNRGAAGGPNAGGDSRSQAEQYLGKKMSDAEFDALIKATHAESAAGKKASQQEQAMIMASILNRARTDQGGVMGALYAKNQFQAVTGTKANNNQPSQQYLQGPAGERLKSIEGAAALLSGVSKSQKDFTAANAGAYGPGTNIGYRDQMLKEGGVIVGDTVFRTAPTSGYKNQLEGTNYNSAGAGTQAQGQKTQAQQAEKTEIMGLAQVLDRIEYNTRNSAREQQKTNRLAS